jgi:hypothetical protein
MFARLSLLVAVTLSAIGSTAHAQDYVWTSSGYLVMQDATSWGNISPDDIIDMMEQAGWQNSQPNRAWIVTSAALAADEHKCGRDAERAYNAAQGDNWCSEFAKTILVASGASHQLDDATGVSDIEDVFKGLHGWTVAGAIRPYTVRPGDYVALSTNGEVENHSGIVIAVANDYSRIWTVEGNVGPGDNPDSDDKCVDEQTRAYFNADGSKASAIAALGISDVLFP